MSVPSSVFSSQQQGSLLQDLEAYHASAQTVIINFRRLVALYESAQQRHENEIREFRHHYLKEKELEIKDLELKHSQAMKDLRMKWCKQAERLVLETKIRMAQDAAVEGFVTPSWDVGAWYAEIGGLEGGNSSKIDWVVLHVGDDRCVD